MERGGREARGLGGGVRVASDAPALGTRAFPLRRRPERGKVLGRARACPASSRSRPARDGAPPRRCLFWETPRARERFAMETAEKQTSRVPPRFSPSIGPARVERASLPDPVARARVRDDAPDSCLTRRSKCESVSLARRTGRFAPVHYLHITGLGVRRLFQIGSRACRARQGRRGSSPRRGRRRHVARVSTRARARRGPPEPRAAFRPASRLPRATRSAPAERPNCVGITPPSTRALTFTPRSIRPPRDGPAGRSTRNGARPCATCSCRWRASSR